jgi:hypothetical protein
MRLLNMFHTLLPAVVSEPDEASLSIIGKFDDVIE